MGVLSLSTAGNGACTTWITPQLLQAQLCDVASHTCCPENSDSHIPMLLWRQYVKNKNWEKKFKSICILEQKILLSGLKSFICHDQISWGISLFSSFPKPVIDLRADLRCQDAIQLGTAWHYDAQSIWIYYRRAVVCLLPVATGLLTMPGYLSQRLYSYVNRGLDEKLLQVGGNLKLLWKRSNFICFAHVQGNLVIKAWNSRTRRQTLHKQLSN